jgi:hypothetical protein
MNEMFINMHVHIYLYLRSVNLGDYCSLKKIGRYTRFIAHSITKIMFHISIRLIFRQHFQAWISGWCGRCWTEPPL